MVKPKHGILKFFFLRHRPSLATLLKIFMYINFLVLLYIIYISILTAETFHSYLRAFLSNVLKMLNAIF